MEEKEKFVPMGTKVNPAMAVVWDAICNALETDTYHLLQHFIQAMIRAASTQHEKSPEVEKLMNTLDLDVGWQNAINLCAPNGKLSIAQIILIVEQEDKEGFSAVMLDKPFMGECQQTENVNLIIERIIQVGTKKLYQKLRDIGAKMRCKWFVDVMLRMIEDQDILLDEKSDKEESTGINDFAENNRRVEYGKRTKRVKHRSTDEYIEQGVIQFGEKDRQLAAEEVKDSMEHDPDAERKWLEENSDYRPFGYEW